MSRADGPRSIEAACTAWRERGVDGRVLSSPAWHDLAPAQREAAFDARRRAVDEERAADPRGWSGTVRAVLARLG